MRAGIDQDKRWVTAAFTWNGLRALGLDEASLASFPEEFKQGMAARAAILGDTGVNAPPNWVGGLGSPDLHAIVILFARDDAEHERCVSEHAKLVAGCPASKSSPCSTFMPFRRSATRMSISATGIGCRSQPSRATVSNRPLEVASL